MAANRGKSSFFTALLGRIAGKTPSSAIPARGPTAITALVCALLAIGLLTVILPKNSYFATLILEHTSKSPFPYPFTIQNLLHVLFFVALGELYVRYRSARLENELIKAHFLPEDEGSVLAIEDLGAIRRRTMAYHDGENGFLPYMIDTAVLQLQSTRSIDQAVSVLSTNLELLGTRVDLRYSIIRYMAWVIPTLGFVGTVTHLGYALAGVRPGQLSLTNVTTSLAIAFNTTLIALLESAVVVLLQNIIQAREEGAVSRAGEYCLRNLINRLYVPSTDSGDKANAAA